MDEAPAMGRQIARGAMIAAGALGALFGVGVVAGLVAAHLDRGDPVGFRLIALLTAAALFAIGSTWMAYRAARAFAGTSGAPTSRERRNRNVLLLCVGVGAVMGMLLTLAGPTPFTPFSNDPLPAALALALAFVIAVPVPLLSLYWHRHVVDEQEAAAYKLGSLFGIYTYLIGAPTWWLLWRGGMLPAPDGIAIYFTTIGVTGAIWLWGKYR